MHRTLLPAAVMLPSFLALPAAAQTNWDMSEVLEMLRPLGKAAAA
jgi:hypothetical protein